ncbi:MAG TPA: PAS-domain containing protein [Ramlibacter sp.]|nr:PAS-domain containing protein [Ramlibacter sp.]
MKSPPALPDEARRLRRLRAMGLLDTGAEAVLDSFTAHAVAACGMPIALISLVDQDRLWFKSAVGLPQGMEAPRSLSLCDHAIAAGPGLFEVEDATRDERFADSPLVIGEPHVVHYAGVPLVMPDGEAIGTICVIDRVAGRLDERDRITLTSLAASVVSVLLLRDSERALRHDAQLNRLDSDITEKVRLQSALMERNSLLESVIESTPCGLVVFDQDMRHIASNRQLRRLLDLPDALFEQPDVRLDTLISFNARRGEYGPGDPADLTRERLALGRGEKAMRIERVRPDGTVLEIRVAAMPNGWQVQTYVDVTEERAAAAGLQASQEQLGLALKATSLGLWEYKPLQDVAYLSESWGQILGYPRQERYMRSAELVNMSVPEHAMGFRDALVNLLKGTTPQLSIEHEARHASGGTIWLLTEAQVTERDDAGRALRVVGTTKDVTQRKREQQALQEAVAAAEIANRAKAEFLATMSHEIRTPINGVIGLARMLDDQPLPPREAGYVRMINSCADTLLGLVNDVLDFSKIEAGQMVLERTDIDLHALVRETGDVFEARARAKDVGFAARIAPDVPTWITVDAHRLRQILLNLLGNALKFTAQGRFSLDVSVGRHDGVHTLRCVVADTGIGIALRDQAKLFKRFSQVDASTTRRYQGTGLGLAISRDLAVLMGGDIEVSSLPGMGSSFALEIPLVAAPTSLEPAKPAAAPQASPARLLLVEDNPVNRLVATALLTRLGYADVTTANDGQVALDLCSAQSFDLILMDCQMPVMDGFEATRRLRAAGFDRPIIALTAGAVTHDRDRCLAMGMNDYLAKPIDGPLLGAAIEVWLKLAEAAGASQLR